MEEPTLQPFLSSLLNKINVIELIELSSLSFAFWFFLSMLPPKSPEDFQLDILTGLFIIVLGSWLLYNVYIFLARIGGSKVDVALWIIASLVTATYTFWAWSILDANRWIVAKLFYRGEAPVEYAWSAQSKLVHKIWRESRKALAKPQM